MVLVFFNNLKGDCVKIILFSFAILGQFELIKTFNFEIFALLITLLFYCFLITYYFDTCISYKNNDNCFLLMYYTKKLYNSE